MLGSSSLNRICRVGTPITRAAWTNSRSRSERTSPRISRASVIQPKSVRMQSSEITWAYFERRGWSANRSVMIGARASAISRNGSDRNVSMMNEMTRSSQPRLKPAIRPMVMPMTVATTSRGGHDQRGAGAVEPLGEVVVAGVGREAERGLPREAVVRRADHREVEDVGVGRRVAGSDLDAEELGDQRREDRDHGEEHDDGEADHGDLVGTEAGERDLERRPTSDLASCSGSGRCVARERPSPTVSAPCRPSVGRHCCRAGPRRPRSPIERVTRDTGRHPKPDTRRTADDVEHRAGNGLIPARRAGVTPQNLPTRGR